jgi:hypothetical protein
MMSVDDGIRSHSGATCCDSAFPRRSGCRRAASLTATPETTFNPRPICYRDIDKPPSFPTSNPFRQGILHLPSTGDIACLQASHS